MNQKRHDELAGILTNEHLRERLDPQPGDASYLHLSDLLLALQAHATEEQLDILDFGAGISPYRTLFPKANYQRADFAIGTGAGLDFVLDESLQVAAPDNCTDFILSTQVLEHVEKARAALPALHPVYAADFRRSGGIGLRRALAISLRPAVF